LGGRIGITLWLYHFPTRNDFGFRYIFEGGRRKAEGGILGYSQIYNHVTPTGFFGLLGSIFCYNHVTPAGFFKSRKSEGEWFEV